jgi:hypothetical protein
MKSNFLTLIRTAFRRGTVKTYMPKNYVKKVMRGVAVQLYAFFISSLDGVE